MPITATIVAVSAADGLITIGVEKEVIKTVNKIMSPTKPIPVPTTKILRRLISQPQDSYTLVRAILI
jgi:hypothetical protein